MKKVLILMFLCIIAMAALCSCGTIKGLHTCVGYEMVALEPTCGEDGEMFLVCETCLDVLDRYPIPATGEHTLGEKVYGIAEYKDCANRPYTQHCTVCGYTHTGRGGFEAHTFETVETVAPTCSERGYDKKICTVCGEVHTDNYTNTIAHDIESEYSTDESFHWYACRNCNYASLKGLHYEEGSGYCTACGIEIKSTPGLIYEISEDGSYATVTEYIGNQTIIRIAEEYRGVPVTHVGTSFLRGTRVKEVVFADNITHIDDSAFHSRTNLTTLKNTDGLTHIGQAAFYNCYSLEMTELPKNIQVIGTNAFADCNKLNIDRIPESVTHIGGRAFSNCHSLVDITVMGDSLDTIGYGAFSYCLNLRNVVIGEGVTTLENRVFERSGIKKITLPDSVVTLGESVFYGCDKLEEIHFGKSFEAFGELSFYNCLKLNKITISAENENYYLQDGVLYTKDMERLVLYPVDDYRENVTIPDGVVILDDYVLRGARMRNLSIPDSVRVIGEQAFSNNISLTTLDLGDGVTEIREGAFAYCKNLTEVKLPSALVTLGEDAFDMCSGIKTIIVNKNLKTVGMGVFYSSEHLSPPVIYYEGTEADWSKIEFEYSFDILANPDYTYFYSEDKPSSEGRFWHYDEDGKPVKW